MVTLGPGELKYLCWGGGKTPERECVLRSVKVRALWTIPLFQEYLLLLGPPIWVWDVEATASKQNIPQVLRFQQAESKDFQPYPIILLVYVKECAYIPPLIETRTEIKKHVCKARSSVNVDMLCRIWYKSQYRLHICHIIRSCPTLSAQWRGMWDITSRVPPPWTGLWCSYVSSINKLWAGWLRFNFQQGKEIFSSPVSRLALGPTQPPIQWMLEAFSLGVQRPGHEAYYSTPSNAKFKNGISILPFAFMAWCLIN
jgi:hypothetical protein